MLFRDENLWIFGMLLNIAGSVTVNFGTNLMKSAHNIVTKQESTASAIASSGKHIAVPQKKQDDEAHGCTTEFIWNMGMFAFVFGSIVNFASFAFAAQSLLACLGTVQFVSNVFFAKFVLKETLTPRIIFATAVIISGLTVAILCSNHTTQTYSTADLRDLYTARYGVFMLFVVSLLLILQAVYMYYVNNEEQGKVLPGHKLVVPCCYALVSAIVGTQSVLQSKCLAELLKATIEGDNQFTHWFLYVILLGFLAGLSFWLYRMNAALKKFDGLIIIPLLQVFWTTSAILQGGVYFQEFDKFSRAQTIGFTMGVLIVFIGVYLLAPVDPSDSELMLEACMNDSSRGMVLSSHGASKKGRVIGDSSKINNVPSSSSVSHSSRTLGNAKYARALDQSMDKAIDVYDTTIDLSTRSQVSVDESGRTKKRDFKQLPDLSV
jgi:hypothetical protein